MSKKQKCREKVKKTMHNTIYRIQPVTKNKQTNKQKTVTKTHLKEHVREKQT